MDIVLGVVTGILSAAVLLVIKHLFTNSFIPWYRQVIYKGIDLSGNWHGHTPEQKTLLELTQSCELLKGKATMQLNTTAFPQDERNDLYVDEIRTFELTGEIHERFVILNLKHTDKTRMGLVAYILQISGDGTTLTGKGSWYSPLTSEIRSGDETLFRNEERAIKELEKLTASTTDKPEG